MANTHQETQRVDQIGQKVSEIQSDLTGVARDVANLKYLYERVEGGMTKLDAASAKLDTMFSLQERSLNNIERMLRERDDKMSRDLETLRTSIEQRFTREETDRKHDFNQLSNKMQDDSKERSKLSVRLDALERFRWLIGGALALIAFCAPYIEKFLTGSGSAGVG